MGLLCHDPKHLARLWVSQKYYLSTSLTAQEDLNHRLASSRLLTSAHDAVLEGLRSMSWCFALPLLASSALRAVPSTIAAIYLDKLEPSCAGFERN